MGCDQVSSLMATVRGDGDIYPLAKGNQWKYDFFVDNEKRYSQIDEVMDVSKVDGISTATIKVTTISVSGQESSVYQILRKSSEEISAVPADRPSYVFLHLPMTVGKAWTVNGSLLTVLGREDVTVTAGTYGGCYKVGTQAPQGSASNWYASGVGLVKSEGTGNGTSTRLDLVSVTLK